MQNEKVVLFKVGGSLFSLPDLSGRLQSTFALTGATRIIVFPGGGPAVDLVRSWDQIHSLEPAVSHWLAIDALSLNARYLASILPESCLVVSEVAVTTSRVSVVDVATVFRELEFSNTPLPPVGWHVTSDSLAAWLAVHWRVDEFVLVKSTNPPGFIGTDSSQPGEIESPVDDWLGTLSDELPPVRWCNLRADELTLSSYEPSAEGPTLYRRA